MSKPTDEQIVKDIKNKVNELNVLFMEASRRLLEVTLDVGEPVTFQEGASHVSQKSITVQVAKVL